MNPEDEYGWQMIKGCVGFSYKHGYPWIGHMILVRGKRTLNIPLIYPLYLLLTFMWRHDIMFTKTRDF